MGTRAPLRVRRVLALASAMAAAAGVALAVPLAMTPKPRQGPVPSSYKPDERDPWAAPEPVAQRQEKVEAELAGLRGHRWAGHYYEGDGLGANISLYVAPGAGVAATWRGCLGLYAAGAGDIVEHPDGHLSFDLGPPREGGPAFDRELLPVRWGERRYLVANDDLVRFASDVNLGFEPRDTMQGSHALADGDDRRPVSGLPPLPPAALAAIRATPLDVRVEAVEALPDDDGQRKEFCRDEYRLTFDRGADDGLVLGQVLRLVSDVEFETVKLVTVEPSRSTAEYRVFDFRCDDGAAVPERGWVFTTGAYAPASAGPKANDR